MISKSESIMPAMVSSAVREKIDVEIRSRAVDMNVLETGYSFGANDSCTIRVASDIEDRKKAWSSNNSPPHGNATSNRFTSCSNAPDIGTNNYHAKEKEVQQ